MEILTISIESEKSRVTCEMREHHRSMSTEPESRIDDDTWLCDCMEHISDCFDEDAFVSEHRGKYEETVVLLSILSSGSCVEFFTVFSHSLHIAL